MYEFICEHPVITTIIALISVVIIGATSFNEDDWKRW